jgi:AcrR family transcriptional regulator
MAETRPTSSADRVLRAAARIFGRAGYSGATLAAVAREAGVSPGLLRRRFDSKAELLLSAQRATFRQLHQRIVERARHGERGVESALDALDGMWGSVRELRAGAPFLVELLSLADRDDPTGERLRAFFHESTTLLEDGIRHTFADDLGALALPPGRMAVVIRVLLQGLVIELARARTPEDFAAIDQSYSDMRELFRRFVVAQDVEPLPAAEPIPLPW